MRDRLPERVVEVAVGNGGLRVSQRANAAQPVAVDEGSAAALLLRDEPQPAGVRGLDHAAGRVLLNDLGERLVGVEEVANLGSVGNGSDPVSVGIVHIGDVMSP